MASRRPIDIQPEFERLPPGQHGLARETVRRSQRIRLQRAMVSAVASESYAKTKIRDLARIAGVSPNAFYRLYESKEGCFLATHDAIAKIEIERVAAAASACDGWEARLRAAIAAFVELVIAQPDAGYLAIVETEAVGVRALEHQQQALAAHERLIREILELAPHGASISDTTVKTVMAGVRSMLHHHLDAGRPQQLRRLIEPIFEWALGYHTAAGANLPELTGAPRCSAPKPPHAGRGDAQAEGDSRGQRERIMRAVAALSCEQGYAALTVPAITAKAGVSNQTFYQHFTNKHDAFLTCYDRISHRALDAMLQSFQAAETWAEAIHASLHTLLGYIAAEPEFARMAFFEVLAAGPAARRRAEARMEGFAAILDPGFALSARPPARIVSALIAGGAGGLIQYHISHGHTPRLAELTPQLTYVALTPFVGAEQAAEVAAQPLVD